jgi:VIT1/CCC1 family predicted Fe2+/Mn2+ transporter
VLSVSVGLSGVYGEPFIVALAGLIVGLTGAFNTLTGFYFFSRTQRQVKLGILKRINAASEHVPHIFVNKVIDHMKGKDLSEETARKIADEAYAKNFLDKIIAEEEYGIKEESLGDPLQTALYAGLFRIIGTVFPLAPYFFNLPFTMAIPMSILITLMMLTVTGSLVALSAEVDVKDKIVELIVSGIILTTLTYLVGKSTSILLDIFIK